MRKRYMVGAILLFLFGGLWGCAKQLPETTDFDLAVEIADAEVAAGETFSYTVTLRNNSGRRLRVQHRTGNLDAMIYRQFYIDPDEKVSFFTGAVEEYWEKNETVTVTQTVEAIEAGEYTLEVWAHFTVLEGKEKQDYTIRLENRNVTVI